MSATDTKQEFYSDLDDWWSQLWVMRAGLKQPKERVKLKFFRFVYDICADVGCWKLGDKNLDSLFINWIDHVNGEE